MLETVILTSFDGRDYYCLQSKLQKGNVFISLCQEFCPQWGCPWADIPPGKKNTPEQTPHGRQTPRPPGRQIPMGRHLL